MRTCLHSSTTDDVKEIPVPILEKEKFAAVKFKYNMASEPDRLNAELLKTDKISLTHKLWKLIEKACMEGIFSSLWEGQHFIFTKGKIECVKSIMAFLC
jgi:hypothetical protein